MARIKLVIAYTGTDFVGWQIQSAGLTHLSCSAGGQRTVQQALEQAVYAMLGTPVRIHGSGRTDSGVHAEGQVAHMDVPDAKAMLDWRRALNAHLPKDIAVLDARVVSNAFHARFDAIKKRYTYRLWLSRDFVLPQRRPFVHAVGQLDIAAMDAAARHMTGRQDYASVQNAGTDPSSTIRTVYAITRTEAFFATNGTTDHTPMPLELAWHFEADGFLKQMVRNMMGLLLWVGTGKCHPDQIPAIMTSRDRAQAAPTAPAHGLTLKYVLYPPHTLPSEDERLTQHGVPHTAKKQA